METRAIYALELRQRGRSLSGLFRYSNTATIRDRGRVRKERFSPRAFSFAVDDAEREVHLLSGHSFDRPLARKKNGTLELSDTDEGLSFTAELPVEGDQPAYMTDMLKQYRAGLGWGDFSGLLRSTPLCRGQCRRTDPRTWESRCTNPGHQRGCFVRAIAGDTTSLRRYRSRSAC